MHRSCSENRSALYFGGGDEFWNDTHCWRTIGPTHRRPPGTFPSDSNVPISSQKKNFSHSQLTDILCFYWPIWQIHPWFQESFFPSCNLFLHVTIHLLHITHDYSFRLKWLTRLAFPGNGDDGNDKGCLNGADKETQLTIQESKPPSSHSLAQQGF